MTDQDIQTRVLERVVSLEDSHGELRDAHKDLRESHDGLRDAFNAYREETSKNFQMVGEHLDKVANALDKVAALADEAVTVVRENKAGIEFSTKTKKWINTVAAALLLAAVTQVFGGRAADAVAALIGADDKAEQRAPADNAPEPAE